MGLYNLEIRFPGTFENKKENVPLRKKQEAGWLAEAAMWLLLQYQTNIYHHVPIQSQAVGKDRARKLNGAGNSDSTSEFVLRSIKEAEGQSPEILLRVIGDALSVISSNIDHDEESPVQKTIRLARGEEVDDRRSQDYLGVEYPNSDRAYHIYLRHRPGPVIDRDRGVVVPVTGDTRNPANVLLQGVGDIVVRSGERTIYKVKDDIRQVPNWVKEGLNRLGYKETPKNLELADIGPWHRTGKTRNAHKVEGGGWFGGDAVYEYEAQEERETGGFWGGVKMETRWVPVKGTLNHGRDNEIDYNDETPVMDGHSLDSGVKVSGKPEFYCDGSDGQKYYTGFIFVEDSQGRIFVSNKKRYLIKTGRNRYEVFSTVGAEGHDVPHKEESWGPIETGMAVGGAIYDHTLGKPVKGVKNGYNNTKRAAKDILYEGTIGAVREYLADQQISYTLDVRDKVERHIAIMADGNPRDKYKDVRCTMYEFYMGRDAGRNPIVAQLHHISDEQAGQVRKLLKTPKSLVSTLEDVGLGHLIRKV